MNLYRRFFKRWIDAVLAGVALFLLFPVWAITALVVRFHLGSPVLFTQRRAGLNGEPFTLLKFRTMRQATGSDGRPLPDEQRLTSVGLLLRRWSLDELPELINVLRGEMSVIGPRPLPVEYLNRYSPRQARRHEVMPGISGLAQVRVRNAVGWDDKFAIDVWYVDHQSFLLDLSILLATPMVVFTGYGVSHAGRATMEEFTGNSTSTPV